MSEQQEAAQPKEAKPPINLQEMYDDLQALNAKHGNPGVVMLTRTPVGHVALMTTEELHTGDVNGLLSIGIYINFDMEEKRNAEKRMAEAALNRAALMNAETQGGVQ